MKTVNNVLIPFYDNIHNPSKILSYALVTTGGSVDVFNNVERPDTPYWRLQRKPVDDLLDDEVFIYDKKTFLKLQDNGFKHNLVNLNTSLWENGYDIIKVDYEDYQRKPINYFINKVVDQLDFNALTYNISDKYDYLLKACAILDGEITVEGEKIQKTYDHFTSGARLRDTTGNTLSMKKERRNKVESQGVVLEVDMDSFHLRILNEFIDGGMPRQVRGHDWIVDQANLDTKKEEPKKQIFRAIYSERFHLVDCKFFHKLARNYRLIDSPFGRTHKNFNYVIQEYEALLMSKIICAINVDYVDFLFYLYDGLHIDLKDPSKVKEFVLLLKEKINLPFTVKVGNLEKRFY